MPETFLNAYIEAALWSSVDDDGRPFDENNGRDDIAFDTLKKMRTDCESFWNANEADIADDPRAAGHDFWLTRNRHGSGFWDGDWPESGDRLTEAAHKFGECDLYVGDDGRIYA